MEKYLEQYSLWKKAELPEELKQQLDEVERNGEELFDRFCRHMTFGTSGLRGKMGVGTNRINEAVIRRANMGVADYLTSKHDRSCMVIGFDTRLNSEKYARQTAEDMALRGIDVYIFDRPTPVPVVSFAIRDLGADGGIMITASHNPMEYNGYKVYDHSGNQIDDIKARKVEACIEKHSYFEKVQSCDNKGTITLCGDNIKEAYFDALEDCFLPWTDDMKQVQDALANLSVVYTPLNGAGRDYAVKIFEKLGIKKIRFVEEQWEHDGTFPTCPSPNPENARAFDLAAGQYADEDTDIIIATDPDSDRMGIMARKDGTFRRLTGDQTGLLMLDYICSCHQKGIGGRNLDGHKTVYKSFVSSPFAEDIAASYGVELVNVPTGFKNIALEMEKLEISGRAEDFLFGFEESLGYLYGNYTIDKDGLLALQMTCLMAACLKVRGSDLYGKLEELYQKHGYVESKAVSIDFKSEKDRDRMNGIMEGLFDGRLTDLMGQKPVYDPSVRELNMYKVRLEGGHQVIIRPSGTEMKIKIYAFARGSSGKEAAENLDELINRVQTFADMQK